MRGHGELNKLKGRIREQKETYRSLSKKTGIPLNTLSNKINGHYLFDIDEIWRMCSVLEIAPADVFTFFIAEENLQKEKQPRG